MDTTGYEPIGRRAGYFGIGLFSILLMAGIFFIISAIIMALWNSCVKKSLGNGIIQAIDYPTAMGLTLFFGLAHGILIIR